MSKTNSFSLISSVKLFNLNLIDLFRIPSSFSQPTDGYFGKEKMFFKIYETGCRHWLQGAKLRRPSLKMPKEKETTKNN